MQLTVQQRRDLIILLVRVAWADGVIVEGEQLRLADALGRLAQGSVSKVELMGWLISGAPEISAPLPAFARELFRNEALGLVGADGDADPQEMRAVKDMTRNCFLEAD